MALDNEEIIGPAEMEIEAEYEFKQELREAEAARKMPVWQAMTEAYKDNEVWEAKQQTI